MRFCNTVHFTIIATVLNSVNLSRTFFHYLVFRLQREALKQSAMDPKTGMIDINILTTGLSITDRKRRLDASKALMELIKGKGRVPTINYFKLFEEFRDQSEAVSMPSSLGIAITEASKLYQICLLSNFSCFRLNNFCNM